MLDKDKNISIKGFTLSPENLEKLAEMQKRKMNHSDNYFGELQIWLQKNIKNILKTTVEHGAGDHAESCDLAYNIVAVQEVLELLKPPTSDQK